MKGRAFFLYWFYRIYSATFRYRAVFHSSADRTLIESDLRFHAPGQNLIYAFFHQDELALIPYFRNKQIVAMVSLSDDGKLMANILRRFGYAIVSGSSNKRPVAAFLEALKKVKQGSKLTFAVDGPRGPIFEVKEGIIRLSQKSGRPIVPVVARVQKFWQFNRSWNKAILPWPGSKIDVHFGQIGCHSLKELQLQLNSIKD